MLLVKIEINDSSRRKSCEISNFYNGFILDAGNNSTAVEITSSSDDIDNYLNDLKDFNILRFQE